MSNPVWSQDQAAGLRNLIRATTCLPVAFIAGQPGLGCTRLVAQVALALANQGENTLILDEVGGEASIVNSFAQGFRYDLAQAMAGDVALNKVLLPVSEQLHLASAVKAGRYMRQNACLPSQAMAATLAQLRRDYRYILLDAAAGEGAHPLTTLGQWVGPLILVVTEGSAALTASFAAMKRFAAAMPHARLKVVVTRTGTEEDARMVFDRLQGVARQHLALELDWLGWVPFDLRWRESPRVEYPIQGVAAKACEILAANLVQHLNSEPAAPGAIQELRQGVPA